MPHIVLVTIHLWQVAMIISSRICLILLVALLVHGAPTNFSDVNISPRESTEPEHVPSGSPHPPSTKLPSGFQLSDNTLLRPNGSPSIRQIITVGGWRPDHDHVYDITEKEDPTVYILPQGTTYHTISMRERTILRYGYHAMYVDVVATTEDGTIILLRKRPNDVTWVRLSKDPIICLPKDPQARVIYFADKKAVEEWCEEKYYEPEVPNGKKRRGYVPYMDHCIFVNLWNVGYYEASVSKFKMVPVLEAIPQPPQYRVSKKKKN